MLTWMTQDEMISALKRYQYVFIRYEIFTLFNKVLQSRRIKKTEIGTKPQLESAGEHKRAVYNSSKGLLTMTFLIILKRIASTSTIASICVRVRMMLLLLLLLVIVIQSMLLLFWTMVRIRIMRVIVVMVVRLIMRVRTTVMMLSK